MKKTEQIVKHIIVILTLCISITGVAESFSVMPMYLEFQPGARERNRPFEVTIKADGPMTVKLGTYKAVQQRNGKLGFVEITKEDSDFQLIKIKQEKHTFNIAGEWKAGGTINFPPNINRTVVYALMIEEEKQSSDRGVGVSVRYAVVLKVQTSNRMVRQQSKIEILGIKKVDDKMLMLAEIENTSDRDFKVSGVVKVRDSNQKIVATIDIRTESSWQKQEKESVVFPSSVVELAGIMPVNLPKGEYLATFYGKIDNRSPISAKKELSILEDVRSNAVAQNAESEMLSMSPLPHDVQFELGKQKRYRFELKNTFKTDVVASLPKPKKDGGKFEIEFAPETMVIPAGKSRTVIMKVTNDVSPELVIDGLNVQIATPDGVSLREPLNFAVKFKAKEK